MKRICVLCVMMLVFAGCGGTKVTPPQWSLESYNAEAEYEPYLKAGTATITGQAFKTKRDGGVVKAAGRTITLDPATSVGTEWWKKAGRMWVHRSLIHPNPAFEKARRTKVADADGRFKFTDLPAGKYYIRTWVTWETDKDELEGGLVGQLLEVHDGQMKEVILH